MSAFLCNDEIFRQLAGYVCNDNRSNLDFLADKVGFFATHGRSEHHKLGRGGWYEPNELATHIANILKAENLRSLDVRYRDRAANTGIGEPETVEPLTLGEVDRLQTADPGAIAKMLSCYEYQACEADDWESTLAFKIAAYIRKEITTRLPGYEPHPWGEAIQYGEPAPEIISLMSMIKNK